MSHVHEGPLATYNSLTDGHLAGYFANSRMRRHLRKAGLVSKRGEIVSESTYRLNMSRREHKRHVKDMLAQAIVHKTLDMERSRQAEIKKKLEEIAKIQLVRRVRASTSKKGDEDILPLLTPRGSRSHSPAAGGRRRGQPHRSQQQQQRPSDMQGVRRGASSRMSDMSVEEEGDVLYLDDEGRPITPAYSDRPRRSADHDNIDTRHLHSLDSVALRKYALLMAQMEEGRGLTSPYMMPQVPLPPRPPSSGPTPRSARRRVQSASPRRTITTDSRLARLHRPETAKSHAGDQQTLCRVTMKYHGWNLHLARERTDNTQEVVVEQQHCGGNTLIVFKERLEPGKKFEFISYRHRGYPFSLSLYVDGQMDSRVSTCCEYRHSRGAKIGGKQGHFSLIRLTGAVPCYKCQVAKGVLVPRKASPKKLKRPAEVRREEVVVVSTRRDKEAQEAEEYTAQDRAGPAEDEEDEEDVVMIPVERDEADDDTGSNVKSAPTDDYADDFDDSQASEVVTKSSASSSSSSSSSESESESETEPRTPKEEGKTEKSAENKQEVFQPVEDRGEERAEKDEEDGVSPRDRGGEQQSSARSPRVEINGTGRQIDDYSSDDEDDKKNKVVSVEDVDAVDNTPIKSRRRSSSSSSSSSSSEDDRAESSREQQGAPVIQVDLLDKEEKKEEDALRERKRRDEIRQKEEQDHLQRQQAERERRMEERKKAEEARRQDDLLRQQRRDEERRQREEQRRAEAEKERQRREEEEESRRRAAQIEDDPEARERERMASQKLRDEQIRQEQLLREEKRRQLDQERERAWKQQEAQREEQRQKASEERERRRQEEGSSSARTDSSTARSTTASSATSSSESASSAESTPRHVPAQQLTSERENSQVARAASPLPAPAVYEDRHRLREPQEDHAVKRPASPLPAPAVYEPRSRLREREREASPPRSVSPLPPPAVYEDRRRARKSENERIPAAAEYSPASKAVPQIHLETAAGKEEEEQPHTGRSTTTEATTTSTADSSSEDDTTSDTRSLEREIEVNQSSWGREKKYDREESSDGEIAPRQKSKRAGNHSAEGSSDEDGGGRSRKRREDPASVDTRESALAKPDQRTAVHGRYEDSGTADSSSDSTSSSDNDNAGSSTVKTTAATDRTKDSTAVTWGQHATSESDGENMHGGADPDNVAQQEEAGELHPLRTREVPVAKAHKGEIMDLVSEGKDSLDLSNVLLNKTQVYQLASHLETSSSVKMISLCNTGLDDDDLQRLTEALCASPSEPLMLNLSLNSIGQPGVQHVLRALKAKPSIKMLILQGNPIGDDGAKDLTMGLHDLHRVARAQRKATAGADSLTSDTASVDSSSSSVDPAAMAQRYVLQELDLTDTALSDDGAFYLAQLVAANVYVENLNLSHNARITAEKGWRHVGEALARNRCIRSLTLDGNKIGDEGLQHIARGLQNNRVLRSLALEDAGLGAQGGRYLMDMLKRNTTLLELTLSPGNSIPGHLEEDIGKYIALNRAPYNNFNL